MIFQVAGQLGLTVLHDHNYAIQEENVSVLIESDGMGSGDTHSETGGPARLPDQVT